MTHFVGRRDSIVHQEGTVHQQSKAPVSFDVVAATGVITLDRPEALNAINVETAKLISEYGSKIEASPHLRVGILTTSSSKAFCAGADLSDMAAGKAKELSLPDSSFGSFTRARKEKPWIAAVAGYAMGGGFEMALAADLIVAADNTVFGLPEALRGIAATGGGLFRLPRTIPKAIAIEMIIAGRRLTAREALTFGLVNAVVPFAALRQTALEMADRVAACGPLAVRDSLTVARVSQDLAEDELWELSAGVSRRVNYSDDAKEGAAAFFDKRAPSWSGR